jgi:hypothetical protein
MNNGGEYVIDWLFDYLCEKKYLEALKTAWTYAPTNIFRFGR